MIRSRTVGSRSPRPTLVDSGEGDLAALAVGLRLTVPEVARLIDELYGLEVTASALDGDRDANYRVVTTAGEPHMFKVIHPDEHPLTTANQDAILIALAEDAVEIRVPRVVPALDGSPSPRSRSADGRDFAVRLVSFLDGVPVGTLDADQWDPEHVGASVGRLMTAMARLVPPVEETPLVWDLIRSREVLELAPATTPLPGDDASVGILESFSASAYEELPWQVLHNDLNPGNVLLDRAAGGATAFIDFGDSVYGPRIAEVAVALSYLIDTDRVPHRWDALATLRGIHSTCPLLAEEVDMLFELITVRLAVTILVAHWRAVHFPNNAAYILRNTDAAVRRLDAMTAAGRGSLTDLFRSVTVGRVDAR